VYLIFVDYVEHNLRLHDVGFRRINKVKISARQHPKSKLQGSILLLVEVYWNCVKVRKIKRVRGTQ
jgi:hypothetical protein